LESENKEIPAACKAVIDESLNFFGLCLVFDIQKLLNLLFNVQAFLGVFKALHEFEPFPGMQPGVQGVPHVGGAVGGTGHVFFHMKLPDILSVDLLVAPKGDGQRCMFNE
jgi:hypothetical protein